MTDRSRRARWKIWAVTAVGAVVIASGVGYAATYTDGGPGQLSLSAGDAVHVHCPTQVNTGNVTAQDFDATCDPNPSTTTVDPSPTTTVDPPTSTTVPEPTTTTVPAPTTTIPAPTTTTTQPPAQPQTGAFPDASNTGVPAGEVLTAYTGPTTITSCGTVIDHKMVNGGLVIRASNGTHSSSTPCVTIKDSLIKGQVDTSYTTSSVCKPGPCGPVVLTDTEVAIPTPNSGNFSAILQTNVYLFRVNVHGARTQMQCDGYCEVHDSYMHDNWFINGAHMGAFLNNGNGSAPILADHSTFLCNIAAGSPGGSGGCSADFNNYGDFATVKNITVTNNLFKASGGQFYYCVYTGANQPAKVNKIGTNLVWTGNTFERGQSDKCGDAGPVADWAYNSGNVWSNNHYDNGAAINP